MAHMRHACVILDGDRGHPQRIIDAANAGASPNKQRLCYKPWAVTCRAPPGPLTDTRSESSCSASSPPPRLRNASAKHVCQVGQAAGQ